MWTVAPAALIAALRSSTTAAAVLSNATLPNAGRPPIAACDRTSSIIRHIRVAEDSALSTQRLAPVSGFFRSWLTWPAKCCSAAFASCTDR
jgi:hypothetical protein